MYIGIANLSCKFWTKLAFCYVIFWKLGCKTKALKLDLHDQTTQSESLYIFRAVLILCKHSSISVRYVSRDIIHVFIILKHTKNSNDHQNSLIKCTVIGKTRTSYVVFREVHLENFWVFFKDNPSKFSN